MQDETNIHGNRSHAVRAQRIEPADSLDWFITPPWATRALCEALLNNDLIYSTDAVWEPACGDGAMSRALSEYFPLTYETDIHYYGCGVGGIDFLSHDAVPADAHRLTSWVITNPPFNSAEAFALRGLSIASKGVALLVRTSFLEGVGRHERLFSAHPPAYVLQFSERVPMFKGRLSKTGSTATSYCWVIWTKHAPASTQLQWIAPCRKRLERDGDYGAAE